MSDPLPEAADSEYCGEWYVLSMTEQEYEHHRTREKCYSFIPIILQVVVGLVPAMGLNVFYAALCYAVVLILLIYQALTVYRAPMKLAPMTYDQYQKWDRRPRILSTATRILVVLNMILAVAGTFTAGLSLTVWTAVQVIVFLLEAWDLQVLYRLERQLQFDVTTEKPAGVQKEPSR